jgi:hypothetical protein
MLSYTASSTSLIHLLSLTARTNTMRSLNTERSMRRTGCLMPALWRSCTPERQAGRQAHGKVMPLSVAVCMRQSEQAPQCKLGWLQRPSLKAVSIAATACLGHTWQLCASTTAACMCTAHEAGCARLIAVSRRQCQTAKAHTCLRMQRACAPASPRLYTCPVHHPRRTCMTRENSTRLWKLVACS